MPQVTSTCRGPQTVLCIERDVDHRKDQVPARNSRSTGGTNTGSAPSTEGTPSSSGSGAEGANSSASEPEKKPSDDAKASDEGGMDSPRTFTVPANTGAIEVVSLVCMTGVDDDEIELVLHHFLKGTSRKIVNSDVGDNDDNSGAEVAVVGERDVVQALRDYAHPRPSCAVFKFSEEGDGDDNMKSCRNCFCVRCEVPANECTDWENHHSLPIQGTIDVQGPVMGSSLSYVLYFSVSPSCHCLKLML